jgi:hypothetical protein
MEDTMFRKAALAAVMIALSIAHTSTVGARERSTTAYPPPALLKQIVIWLRANFDLPRILVYPNIEFVPQGEINALSPGGFVWEVPRDIVTASQRGPLGERDVNALYDDEMKTIYLPEVWTGSTPQEQSLLIHEMVHHLQSLGKLKYDCPQAREQLAYDAQEKWLGLSGRSLAGEFRIDPFILAMSTRCIY